MTAVAAGLLEPGPRDSAAPRATSLGGRDPAGRVALDGKFFAVGGERFVVRGVTYGTFRPRGDGARFPVPSMVASDFAAMQAAGFNVVRTYTVPPEDVLDLAAAHGLRVLAGIFYPDWRYLLGHSLADQRLVVREARSEVASQVRRLAGRPGVFAVSVGNEIPADVLRWVGHRRVADVIGDLTDLAHDIDPDRLVTYTNYPTAEYLTVDRLDFLTFNVYLEQRGDFRKYLTRLHNLAGDRPLVLGEVGISAGEGDEGEQEQAAVLEWQLATAVERGVAGSCVFAWTDEWHVGDADVTGWRFGLTTVDRVPRPALATVAECNRRTVADIDFPWPSVSVVVCAHNARATVDECLVHVCALDYPRLEVIVVDDGSDDGTADIVRRHPRARLVQIAHGGLSVARNAGIGAASGDLVAFIDADAYPSPEWLHYLALGLDDSDVCGVGGPNVPPRTDPPAAQAVARAPGGPAHVLLSDDRAEHLPGCNMAFWRDALNGVGGFNPVYTAAGDDIDVCWKLIDRGWSIAFHPAAMVWHHRRAGLGAYLRQQRGYGRAETLVAARHPDRFTALGTARWRGPLYDAFPPQLTRSPIYRGPFGTAPFQSIYRSGGHALDVAHQAGIPVAMMLAPALLLGALSRAFMVLGVLAAVFLIGLFGWDVARVQPPRLPPGQAAVFRLRVALFNLLQPVVRLYGRWSTAREAGQATSGARDAVEASVLPGPFSRRAGGTLLVPLAGPRAAVAAGMVVHLRMAGFRVRAPTGWEDHDFEVIGSTMVAGEVVSSSHLDGTMQVRVRLRPRLVPAGAVVALAAVAATVTPLAAALVVVAAALDAARGAWRAGPRVIATIEAACAGGQLGAPRPQPKDERVAAVLARTASDGGASRP